MITFLDYHYVHSRWSGRVKLNSHGYESQGLAEDKLSLSLSAAEHLDCVESGHTMIWTVESDDISELKRRACNEPLAILARASTLVQVLR
jgi:hypothetical protein